MTKQNLNELEKELCDAISQINKLKLKIKSAFHLKSKIELEKNLEILRKNAKKLQVDKEYIKKSHDYLNYLLSQAQAEANETYEQALENCFNHYFEKECDANDNINEARDDFEQSSYYFLTVEDFEKQKNKNLNSLEIEAQKELVNSIDTLSIEDLRELKKIYNQIVKIVDSNQVDFNNDCKLVY